MEQFYIILIFIILLVLLNLITLDDDDDNDYDYDNDNYNVLLNDQYYFDKFLNKSMLSKLIDNNILKTPIKKYNRILFITYDDRKNEEYINIHNHNINAYVKKWNYVYKFYNHCSENTYWCKIYIVLYLLKQNVFDYVVWLDSDTIIKNFDVDIGKILNKYSSDIYIGSDNNPKFNIINSGVFIIKNSTIGINFLNDCINKISKKCINDDGSLKGEWAASCYEQGIMNIVIADKYQKYTTVLPNKYIFNYNVCSDDVFIMHLYASSPSYRKKCFNSNNPALNSIFNNKFNLIYNKINSK